MANVKLNALVDGVSGKVGKNIVLRQRGGRTLLGTKPEPSLNLSEKQKAQRERFQQAARFAKSILLSPEAKAEYEKLAEADEFLTPYSAAVTDFLTSPEIAQIDAKSYDGKVGDKMVVRSGIDFKVMSANVSIFQADGSLLESGEATSLDAARLEWVYVASKPVAVLTGVKVVATVTDRPGKQISAEIILK
jgi:hypothetical protein